MLLKVEATASRTLYCGFNPISSNQRKTIKLVCNGSTLRKQYLISKSKE